MAFGQRENGIWGGALLFCDQKRFQKSLAVSTQRTPTRGTRPPSPPKRLKILNFTPKSHDRTAFGTKSKIFVSINVRLSGHFGP